MGLMKVGVAQGWRKFPVYLIRMLLDWFTLSSNANKNQKKKIYIYIRLTVSLSIYLSVCLSISLSVCWRSLCPSIHPSIHPSIQPPTQPSIRPSTSLYFCFRLLHNHSIFSAGLSQTYIRQIVPPFSFSDSGEDHIQEFYR